MRSTHTDRGRRRVLAGVVICLAGSTGASAAMAAVTTENAAQAIEQRICFEAFWWDRNTFQLGKTVPITLRKDGDIAYAWSTDLSKVPGVTQWANFFTVFSEGGRTVVGSSFGYNLDAMQRAPVVERNKAKVFGGRAETIYLHVPANCSPHFVENTPLKERMLKAVGASIMKELVLLNKSGVDHYHGRIHIVVANFNPGYPEAQVYIPSANRAFHVALQDSSNPLGGVFLKQGEYPVRPEYNKSATKVMKAKIVKYGVDREIVLGKN